MGSPRRDMTNQQKHYRSHWEIARVALRYMQESNIPLPSWKIYYHLQNSAQSVNRLIEEMEYLGLVKAYVRGYEYTSTQRLAYSITGKGIKLLELLDAQAKLLSKSPWIQENINR